MTSFRIFLSSIVVAAATQAALAQTDAPAIAFATKHVGKEPTLEQRLGLAEMHREQGRLGELHALAGTRADIQELVCWRMLPLPPAKREEFGKQLTALKELHPGNPWTPILDVYLLTGQSDRAALLQAIDRLPAELPARFPGEVGEKAHLTILRDIGTPRLTAGMQVIAARSHDPLHALRDLDRALSREAEFLHTAGREQEEKKILDARDRLRRAYLASARHLVERLFALNLAGKMDERNALIRKAQGLTYLHDRRLLAGTLERLDEQVAWTRLIEPMLAGEMTIVNNPPELPQVSARPVAELNIRAEKKIVEGKTVHYEGNVRFHLRGIDVTCGKLTLVQANDPASVILQGADKIELRGFATFPQGVHADRFAYHAESGAFTLGGDIRLQAFDRVTKWRTCILTARGDVREPHSLLDDFREAFSLDAKLALLPRIGKVYTDDELPDEARFLLAIEILRTHLSWHAPYPPAVPERNRRELQELVKRIERVRERHYSSGWQEAMGGEPWTVDDVSDEAQEAFRTLLREWYGKANKDPRANQTDLLDIPIPGKDLYFWRLRDPRHAEVARAMRLLQNIRAEEYSGKAHQWREEIARNNTVVTFDIPGAAAAGRSHHIVMDARNADRVRLKLYRVKRPEELLHATRHIGKDFIYRDHGIDLEQHGLKRIEEIVKHQEKSILEKEGKSASKENEFVPSWQPEQLVHEWDVRVADLKVHYERRYRSRSWREDRWWDDELDAHYFGDECYQHRARLEKDYRTQREDQLSSWQCNRIVEIPGKYLADAGAFVLIAEANGQKAHVPIVVEPISLTLRRCRDGVFVQASDASGAKPLAGAKVYARGMIGDAQTDKQGVAFARVFAAGDRPIVVHHEGRFAIGGFGAVFEGIYAPAIDDHYMRDMLKRARHGRADRKEMLASVYEDRHVIAAYTDRPTYRPGQEVKFKFLVRKLIATSKGEEGSGFRDADFDHATRFALPDRERGVAFAVTDPKGHEVARGSCDLSEFGTAAGSVQLNDETVLGAYSFRIRIKGEWRIVPEVFAVKHYRRLNFEVTLQGVPQKLTMLEGLKVHVKSQYYFGPPVANGSVEVRVFRKTFGDPLVETHHRLDGNGLAEINVRLPRELDPGAYIVVCSVTDESGLAVTATSPFTLEGPPAPAGTTGLDALPRFVAVNQSFKVNTQAKEIHATQQITSLSFRAVNGVATLTLPEPGWYQLTAGEQKTSIFAYGGNQPPTNHSTDMVERDDEDRPRVRTPKWVNLSDFTYEEHDDHSRWEKPWTHLYALFDQYNASVGDKLRLLVYVPTKQAKLLFTFEARTILDYTIVQTSEAGYQVVELPIKPQHFPNFYLQGRILDGAQPREDKQMWAAKKLREVMQKKLMEETDDSIDPQWCRVDVRKPKEASAPGLTVKVETDRSDYRPGDTVNATVKVTDSAGKPQYAELSLAAVDDSVFAFGEDNLDALPAFFRSPYEARRFLPKPWRTSLGHTWSKANLQIEKDQLQQANKQLLESLSKAMESLKSEQAMLQGHTEHFTSVPLSRLQGEMPATQIPIARLRENFRETAAWLPQLTTDANGEVRTSFTLPDSLTRYRLTSLAITKDTEVGVGRARITASMPLAAQVILPRFAVEKDRIQALAIVHNNTDAERTCKIEWTIDGAGAESPNPAPADWKLAPDAGRISATGQVKIAARSSAKVAIWLKLDQIGTATVKFRAVDGKDGDGETRTLPVQALGKQAEVVANDNLAAAPNQPAVKEVRGNFNKQGKIDLPNGFLANEIHLSLACNDIAQSLDGLDYLVEYPYGCIEQTMSRFMPLVMVKHATRNSQVRLQPDVEAKMPKVLAEGLTRVYGHQHADGSWGWFQKDSRNLPMSVYVVYGLARCQATGTKVDAEVLQRGCEFLKNEIKEGKHEPETIARAWYALALAGHADTAELSKVARAELASKWDRPIVYCTLALACKTAGQGELGQRLWAKRSGSWWGHDTESFALVLNAEVAFGAPYGQCRTSAQRLLSRRNGAHWHHTRDTAWAIEALSNMLGYIPEQKPIRKIEVTLAGKKVLEVKDADELKKLIFRVHLKGDEIPKVEGAQIRMEVDGDEPVHVAFRATGVQRQDVVLPAGTNVQLTRTYETLAGEPVRGSLKIGDVVRVRLRLDLHDYQRYLLLEERRPALCEFAHDAVSGLGAREAVHQEFRDDRLCVFFSSLAPGTHEIIYYLRAETLGQCTVTPGCAYPMYDEKVRGETGSSKVEVAR
jgi:uncharacterized protein YfaS (alpha-2-macroglobulin family)